MKHTRNIVVLSVFLFLCIISGVNSQEIRGRSGAYSFTIGQKITAPPILEVDKSNLFEDENHNRVLDPYEKASIAFKIQNTGKGDALGVKVNVTETTSTTGIVFTKSVDIGNIPANTGKSVNIPVSSDFKLLEGISKFQISFYEKNGFEPSPFEVTLQTTEFESPAVKIVDYEPKGKMVTKGTPFKIELLLQNLGKGKASDVNIVMRNPENTFLVTGTASNKLKDMAPNETIKITYSLIANSMYQKSNVVLDFMVSEKYASFGDSKTYDIPIAQSMTYENLAVTPDKQADVKKTDPQITIAQLGVDVDKNIPTGTKKNAENTYVLAIGNEDYTKYQNELKSESNVEFAVRDAIVFSEYCKKAFGIPEANITVVENAIESQMKREIERLVSKVKIGGENIEIIFFYSGHGFPDEERESYIMPVDISGTNVKDGIKLTDLYRNLTQAQCKRVTIFIDACFSGGGRNAGLIAAKAVKILPKEITVDGNIAVFTASSGTEVSSFYKGKDHGIFTYFLLKKLQETKGALTYGELYEYLKVKVPFTSTDLLYKQQNPQVFIGPQIEGKWQGWTFK